MQKNRQGRFIQALWNRPWMNRTSSKWISRKIAVRYFSCPRGMRAGETCLLFDNRRRRTTMAKATEDKSRDRVTLYWIIETVDEHDDILDVTCQDRLAD